jgi:hypothetical protein
VSIQVLQDEGLISNDELENRIGMGFVHVRKLRRRLRACLTPATHQSLILHQRRRLPRSLPPRRSPRPSRARPRAPKGRSQTTSATTPPRRAASGGTKVPPPFPDKALVTEETQLILKDLLRCIKPRQAPRQL